MLSVDKKEIDGNEFIVERRLLKTLVLETHFFSARGSLDSAFSYTQGGSFLKTWTVTVLPCSLGGLSIICKAGARIPFDEFVKTPLTKLFWFLKYYPFYLLTYLLTYFSREGKGERKREKH